MINIINNPSLMAKKKRILPVFKFNMKSNAKIEQVYNHPELKRIVIKELIEAVKEGIRTKRKSINLFQISDSDLIIEVSREDWKPALNKALNYYAELDTTEDYKKCVEIRDMIKQL